jgi:hypothetical protein
MYTMTIDIDTPRHTCTHKDNPTTLVYNRIQQLTVMKIPNRQTNKQKTTLTITIAANKQAGVWLRNYMCHNQREKKRA